MEILLNPGPVNLSERVRQSLNKPDLCHREVEFTELQNSIRKKLLEVYGLDPEVWAAVLITGSGTSAMEAMLTSVPTKNDKVLIIENGVYGERLSKIAEIYSINHQSLKHEWGEAVDLEVLDKKITNEITYVALIHHETTTGRLNDLNAIANLCREKNIPMLVDAVSSFGAEEVEFNKWNISACAGTANKCLHGVPGTSFVIVKRESLSRNDYIQRSLYLDLASYLKQQDAGGTPFTQSVQTFYALDEALSEQKDQGGWRERRKSYWQKMDTVRDGLLKLGIKPLLEKNESSCVLNSFHLPEGISYQDFHDQLKQKGFIIYAGQGGLAKSLFRVSPMGAVTTEDMERFIDSVSEIVKTNEPS